MGAVVGRRGDRAAMVLHAPECLAKLAATRVQERELIKPCVAGLSW